MINYHIKILKLLLFKNTPFKKLNDIYWEKKSVIYVYLTNLCAEYKKNFQTTKRRQAIQFKNGQNIEWTLHEIKYTSNQ